MVRSSLAVTLGKTAALNAVQNATSADNASPGSTLGERARAEKPQRFRRPTGAATPLQDLYGTISPADLHFERHHASVPRIDPKSYSLLIHGMVERPMLFTLADLKRFPAVSRTCWGTDRLT